MPGLIITFIIAIASGVFITAGLDEISSQPPQPSPSTQVERPVVRTVTPKPSPSTKPTPKAQAPKVDSPSQITCTGPDGKQFQTTQKECDEFNKAWGNEGQQLNAQQPSDHQGQINHSSNSYYPEIDWDTTKNEPKAEYINCRTLTGYYYTTQELCDQFRSRDVKNEEQRKLREKEFSDMLYESTQELHEITKCDYQGNDPEEKMRQCPWIYTGGSMGY